MTRCAKKPASSGQKPSDASQKLNDASEKHSDAPQKPPAKKTTGTTKYSFPGTGASTHHVSGHRKVFKCKLLGIPRPQARSFATTKGTRKTVKLFNPSKANQKSFEDAFKDALKTAPSNFFSKSGNPCSMTIRFYFPRPKSHYTFNSRNNQYELITNAPFWVTKSPDLDNCVKLVMDALQDVCYENDLVVAHIDAAKLFDHTQIVWNQDQKTCGCTIIQISEMNGNKPDEDCPCLACKKKK